MGSVGTTSSEGRASPTRHRRSAWPGAPVVGSAGAPRENSSSGPGILPLVPERTAVTEKGSSEPSIAGKGRSCRQDIRCDGGVL
jgi:hypothetical protein